MCIILLAENKHLTKDILKKAENNNPHGAGIAWINQKTKRVQWIKAENLTADKIYKIIKSKKIQLPYVVHFRITSIGETCNELCHPFDLNASLNENKLNGSSSEYSNYNSFSSMGQNETIHDLREGVLTQ